MPLMDFFQMGTLYLTQFYIQSVYFRVTLCYAFFQPSDLFTLILILHSISGSVLFTGVRFPVHPKSYRPCNCRAAAYRTYYC